jgi:hypothetical protein
MKQSNLCHIFLHKFQSTKNPVKVFSELTEIQNWSWVDPSVAITSPGADVMIFKIFLPKKGKKLVFLFKTLQNLDHNIGF